MNRMNKGFIRYSPDASVCVADWDGEFSVPTQAEMNTVRQQGQAILNQDDKHKAAEVTI